MIGYQVLNIPKVGRFVRGLANGDKYQKTERKTKGWYKQQPPRPSVLHGSHCIRLTPAV